MPTEQPTNAPQGEAPQLRDADTPAAVMSDDRLDDAPGGGGLMGAGAGGSQAGSAEGRAGAATPNSPTDAQLPHDGGDGTAAAEARTRSLGDEPNERGAP